MMDWAYKQLRNGAILSMAFRRIEVSRLVGARATAKEVSNRIPGNQIVSGQFVRSRSPKFAQLLACRESDRPINGSGGDVRSLVDLALQSEAPAGALKATCAARDGVPLCDVGDISGWDSVSIAFCIENITVRGNQLHGKIS